MKQSAIEGILTGRFSECSRYRADETKTFDIESQKPIHPCSNRSSEFDLGKAEVEDLFDYCPKCANYRRPTAEQRRAITEEGLASRVVGKSTPVAPTPSSHGLGFFGKRPG